MNTKTLEEYVRNDGVRDKAMEQVNAALHALIAAEKRYEKAALHFETIATEAEVTETNALAELDAEMQLRREVILAATHKLTNDAKSNAGTAGAELEKSNKKYKSAITRLNKLLPPIELAEGHPKLVSPHVPTFASGREDGC